MHERISYTKRSHRSIINHYHYQYWRNYLHVSLNGSRQLIFFACFFMPIDIDECVSGVHDCHSSASCTNNAVSYTCSCNNPYTGDGKTCTYPVAGEYCPLTLLYFKYVFIYHTKLRFPSVCDVFPSLKDKLSGFSYSKISLKILIFEEDPS